MSDTSQPTPAPEAPKSALDAQMQGHAEHADQVADKAALDAAAAQKRAEEAAAVVEAAESQPAAEPSEVQKAEIAARASVKVTQVVKPLEPMETDEETRLAGIKTAVVGHLQNAEPDMTAGHGPDTTVAADQPAEPAPAPAP